VRAAPTPACLLTRVQVDNERVRRLFLTYITRLRAALTSPRYNYFRCAPPRQPAG
jgi:hypothetical protein